MYNGILGHSPTDLESGQCPPARDWFLAATEWNCKGAALRSSLQLFGHYQICMEGSNHAATALRILIFAYKVVVTRASQSCL